MDRRKFFRNGSLFTIGTAVLNPFESIANTVEAKELFRNKKAKNIIFLVSDGMSQGTLNMADVFKYRKTGQHTHWIQGYKDNKLIRGLMDTESASSLVTDSAAGGSAWGSGFRVNNGSINVGTKGEAYLPILQKFKQKGKKVGCVTSVPITHATPSSFCVNSTSRGTQEGIAESYLEINFDVMMGAGDNFFNGSKRKDKRDLTADFAAKGYQVVRNKTDIGTLKPNVPVLGLFGDNGMEYDIDRQNDSELIKTVPTLAQMTIIPASARNFGHTTSRPAPRKRIAWLAATKCVVGAASIIVCTNSGILSRGVKPPESSCRGSRISTASNPNCGIDRAKVAMKIPNEVVANRCSADAARKSATEPSIGTRRTPCTTNTKAKAAAISTTRPIDQIFADMISNGVTGITSKCSMVPCSRSRINAAPVKMIESIVTLLMISINEPNQDGSKLGLNRTRGTSSTGGVTVAR